VTVRENQSPSADIRVDSLFVNCGEVVRFRSSPRTPRKTSSHTLGPQRRRHGGLHCLEPVFVYRRGGDYQVTLTVTDELANTTPTY